MELTTDRHGGSVILRLVFAMACLAGAVPVGADEPAQVAVQDASGIPGILDSLRPALTENGFVIQREQVTEKRQDRTMLFYKADAWREASVLARLLGPPVELAPLLPRSPHRLLLLLGRDRRNARGGEASRTAAGATPRPVNPAQFLVLLQGGGAFLTQAQISEKQYLENESARAGFSPLVAVGFGFLYDDRFQWSVEAHASPSRDNLITDGKYLSPRLQLRYLFFRGRVRPYLEAGAGPSFFFPNGADPQMGASLRLHLGGRAFFPMGRHGAALVIGIPLLVEYDNPGDVGRLFLEEVQGVLGIEFIRGPMPAPAQERRK